MQPPVKFKSMHQYFSMLILIGTTAKFNSHQYFRLYDTANHKHTYYRTIQNTLAARTSTDYNYYNYLRLLCCVILNNCILETCVTKMMMIKILNNNSLCNWDWKQP